MTRQKLLNIYLADHHAGAVVGQELAKRCLSSNSGSELGSYLSKLLNELDEDRSRLESVMDTVGAQPDRVKVGAAWFAEKVGRLKLNGQVRGYSDLSRLVELEGLCMGVDGKMSLWRSLQELSAGDIRLAGFDFRDLEARAHMQRESLETHRRTAAASAFTGRDAPTGC
ncbi:MAG: hypothetical protein M3P18_15365 [Actinomycetota bacterium]|nr:hypothetical protein [Actinomycetota bacterium]